MKKGINFKDVTIGEGFWGKRQQINAETTIYSIWDRFKETGRFDSLNFTWKEGDPQSR